VGAKSESGEKVKMSYFWAKVWALFSLNEKEVQAFPLSLYPRTPKRPVTWDFQLEDQRFGDSKLGLCTVFTCCFASFVSSPKRINYWASPTMDQLVSHPEGGGVGGQ